VKAAPFVEKKKEGALLVGKKGEEEGKRLRALGRETLESVSVEQKERV